MDSVWTSSSIKRHVRGSDAAILNVDLKNNDS
jgi:hypothetical protein